MPNRKDIVAQKDFGRFRVYLVTPPRLSKQILITDSAECDRTIAQVYPVHAVECFNSINAENVEIVLDIIDAHKKMESAKSQLKGSIQGYHYGTIVLDNESLLSDSKIYF